jgi:hypothetical protein
MDLIECAVSFGLGASFLILAVGGEGMTLSILRGEFSAPE